MDDVLAGGDPTIVFEATCALAREVGAKIRMSSAWGAYDPVDFTSRTPPAPAWSNALRFWGRRVRKNAVP